MNPEHLGVEQGLSGCGEEATARVEIKTTYWRSYTDETASFA